MGDLVVTCPKGFWLEWIAEGQPAGAPESGIEWGWYLGGARPAIEPGDRLYVVAWGRLRGWAPVTVLRRLCFDPRLGAKPPVGTYADVAEIDASVRASDLDNKWCICRRGGAEAVTIAEPIPGFRGWRKRWWERSVEIPFREWQTEGVGIQRRRAA